MTFSSATKRLGHDYRLTPLRASPLLPISMIAPGMTVSGCARECSPSATVSASSEGHSSELSRVSIVLFIGQHISDAAQWFRSALKSQSRVYFVANVLDVYVHKVSGSIVRLIPHIFHQLRARNGKARIAHEIFEQAEFSGTQIELSSRLARPGMPADRGSDPLS